MYSGDERRGTTSYVTSFHLGLNLFAPKDALQDGQLSDGYGFRIKQYAVVPPKGITDVVEEIGDPVYGLFAFEDNLIILTGNTAYKYYNGSLVDITPGDGFEEASTEWGFTVALNSGTPCVVLYDRAGLNPVYYWEPSMTEFTSLGVWATAAVGYRGRLLIGNVYDSGGAEWLPFRLQWSAINDLTTWDSGTAGFYDFIESADVIQGFIVLPEDQLLVLRSSTIWTGYPTGDVYDPLSLRLLARVGVAVPSSIQSFGTGGFFLGTDDVYVVTPNGPQPVGLPVREQILVDVEENAVWSFYDQRSKEYYLVVGDDAWIFNHEEQAWSRQDMTGINCLEVWYAPVTSP